MGDILYKEESYKLVGAAYDVYNELGFGYSERVYQRAYVKELKGKSLSFKQEVKMPYTYQEETLGYNRIDVLFNDKIVIELKVGRYIRKEHYIQVRNYLNASKYRLGIIILFSPHGVKFKRVVHDELKGKASQHSR